MFSYCSPILSKITVEGPILNDFSLLSIFLTITQTFIYRKDSPTLVTLISNLSITRGVPIFPRMFLAISGVTTGVIFGVVISGVALIKDEVLLTVEELAPITGIELLSFIPEY